MTHEFTPAEQTAIEQAAADYLAAFLTGRDAADVAYDIANAIRPAIVNAAFEAKANELADALPTLDLRHQD